ncbi:DUF6199 family natural product biosynthesis protein [Flintibacter muris]|uniref:DUF6199 family natural product biosynthesis protein n=1 Tax=Flintibacter muris TaxID=2941327 RepID=UPI0020400867|nr:DUF6199 family natural product biosynthesis protein [Flintibacter muris]
MYLILSIILIFAGLVMAFSPEFVYELQEGLRSDAVGTPSKFFIGSTRFGGVLSILVGLVGVISFFVL